MQCTVERAIFASAVNEAASAVNSRSPKEAMQSVLLQSQQSVLTVVGSDFETAISSRVAADVRRAGDVLVRAELLVAILRATTATSIQLATDRNTLHLDADGAHYRLPTGDPADYPVAPQPSDGALRRIEAHLLVAALRRGTLACERETARYALEGVLIEADETHLYCVATDGRRLAARTLGVLEQVGPWPESCLLPRAAADMLAKLLGRRQGTAVLKANANWVWCETDDLHVSLRRLDGRFPQWRDVIPSGGNPTTATVSAGVLLVAARQAATVTAGDKIGVTIEPTADGSCCFHAGTQLGESQVVIEGMRWESPQPSAVTINAQYLIEHLRELPSDTAITIEVRDADKLIVLRDESGVYLVMPMHNRS